MGNFSLIISCEDRIEKQKHMNQVTYSVALKCKDTNAKTEPYHSGEATITQLRTCVIKIVHIQMNSPNVKTRDSQPEGTALKRKEFAQGANSFL